MKIINLIDQIKKHPDYHRAGMILCHNGVVRETSREDRKVSGLRIRIYQERLKQVVDTHKNRPGIIEILVEIAEDRDLAVGEDVMLLLVAGDIRENVISTLTDTLNAIKTSVTEKVQFFV